MRKRNPIIRMLDKSGPLIAWSSAVLFIAMFVDIATPLFSQVFIDSIITHKHPEWETPVAILLAVVLVISLVNVFFGQFKTRMLTNKYKINFASRMFWHALRIPVQAYSTMSPSDFSDRYAKGFVAYTQIFSRLIPVINSCLQVLIMITLMVLYSPILSLVSMVSVFANVLSLRFVAKSHKKKSIEMNKCEAEMDTFLSMGIKNIEAVKSSGAELSFFRKAMDYYTRFINQSFAVTRSQININFLPSFLQQATSIISLCLGSLLIMKGEMTVGLLLAFQGFLNQFLAPITALTRTNHLLLTASATSQRVMDVMDIPTDVEDSIELNPSESLGKLSGFIELKNVTFGYDRNLPPIIENFSLKIEPGKSIAFVGGSGSGKSTIANLITGLYQPWSGEVLYDGKKKNEINRYAFYNSVSVVNQDIVLFDGTVADNIKMWDDVIEDFSMVIAANAAQIHKEIASRPEGYDTRVIGGGSNFSGGQRQRIEIATAIAKEPTIMIMDEATSALDPVTENKLMEAIKAQGITTVIVAHRLSTIRDSDEIFVMDKGHVIERGNHDQLMQNCDGLYYKLMQMN